MGDNRDIPFEEKSWAFGLALLLTMSGGLVIAADVFVDVPMIVGLPALAAFLVGALIVLGLSYRDARQSGTSVFRALGRGIKTFGRWLLAFMP